MVQKISSKIEITVVPRYEMPSGDAKFKDHVFSYDVRITNRSLVPVRLIRRKWEIFDSNGIYKDVEGEGVVGRQPLLQPGESYGYRSAVSIISDIGRMGGYYTMIDMSTLEEFEVEIPAFDLVVPSKLN